MNDLPTLSPILAELKKRLFELTNSVEQLRLRIAQLEQKVDSKWWWK